MCSSSHECRWRFLIDYQWCARMIVSVNMQHSHCATDLKTTRVLDNSLQSFLNTPVSRDFEVREERVVKSGSLVRPTPTLTRMTLLLSTEGYTRLYLWHSCIYFPARYIIYSLADWSLSVSFLFFHSLLSYRPVQLSRATDPDVEGESWLRIRSRRVVPEGHPMSKIYTMIRMSRSLTCWLDLWVN